MVTDSLSESRAESLVLTALQSSSSLTMDQLLAHLPELRWNEVFHVVDRLSRRGTVTLHRKGFEYEVHCSQLAAMSSSPPR